MCASLYGVEVTFGKYTFHEFDVKLFFPMIKNTKSVIIQIYKVMFFTLFWITPIHRLYIDYILYVLVLNADDHVVLYKMIYALLNLTSLSFCCFLLQ